MAGTSCDDLVALYKCFILPLIYYSSVVYHSLLTSGQADSIENLQATAIKIIYGYSKSYLKILEQHSKKLECLHDRRERLVDKFVLKASENGRFCDRWFPKKNVPAFDLRNKMICEETFARPECLYNSPIFYYRRRLNDILRT